MKTAIFYHAGCPICVEAEQQLATAINPKEYKVEVVHLGTNKGRITEAKNFGVKSVPALVLDKVAFHINFGAAITDLA